MKQREIKFRAYVIRSEAAPSINTMRYEDNSTIFGWIADGVTLELMQFTGLLDRNGKECYEGDILALDYPLADGGDTFNEPNYLPITVTISFQNGCFWFTGEGYTDCNWHFYNASDREIIGNIYQNPDLLKWLTGS